MNNQPTVSLLVLIEKDSDSGYPIAMQIYDAESAITVHTLLSPILCDSAKGDIGLSASQIEKLDAENLLGKVCAHGNVALREIELSADFPYIDHAGYELASMRSGRKQLAVFHFSTPADAQLHAVKKVFAPYVSDGCLYSREMSMREGGVLSEKFDSAPIKGIFFAVHGQEWRIEAYKLLRETQRHTGFWNDDLDRVNGMLLGYTNTEIDARQAHRKKRGLRFGFATLYCPISTIDEAEIKKSGLRVLPQKDSGAIELFVSSEGVEPILENLYKGHSGLFARFCISRKNLNRKLAKVCAKAPTVPFEPYIFRYGDIQLINSLIDGDVTIINTSTDLPPAFASKRV